MWKGSVLHDERGVKTSYRMSTEGQEQPPFIKLMEIRDDSYIFHTYLRADAC